MMKKNLAIITTKLTDGGAERVAAILSSCISSQYETYIIVYNDEKLDYPYKGNLISLDSKPAYNFFSKIYNFVYRIYKIRRIKRKYKIQTSISFMEGPNIINIFSKCEDKIIISVHTFISRRSSNYWGIYKKLIRMFYNRADTIIAVSKAIKEDLSGNFGINQEKVKVIYNMIDFDMIQRLAYEEIEEKHMEIFETTVIVNVGRLIKVKGQWHLIRAFKKVKENIPDIKLLIIGKGELEDYLVDLASKLDLEKDVYFLGFQTNPFKYISRSKIFAISSICEGLGNALIEGMASGLPIISTDCKSGPREILAPDTDMDTELETIQYAEYGILIPACDEIYYDENVPLTKEETILADSMIMLAQRDDLKEKYSKLSKIRAKDFNIDEILPMWLKTIE
ncbi:MAG: glycosyltransferase [Lutispora sp.]|nr:glycosyltransferase [Lutispora sp.]